MLLTAVSFLSCRLLRRQRCRAGNVAGKYGLERSEFIAIKKANKDPRDFKKALLKQKIEKLQEQGVVVETTTSGKTTKKPR